MTTDQVHRLLIDLLSFDDNRCELAILDQLLIQGRH